MYLRLIQNNSIYYKHASCCHAFCCKITLLFMNTLTAKWKTGAVRQVPYLLSFVLIVFLLASLVLYGEENLFMDFGSPDRLYPTAATLLTLIAYLPLLLAIYVVGKKRFGIRTSWFWLIVSFLFMVLSILPLWVVEGPLKDGQTVFTLDLEGKIRYTALSIYVGIGLYFLFAYVPKMVKGTSFFHIVASLIILYSLIAIIYSLIAEFDSYASFLQIGEKVIIPHSFYLNRNAFGFTVFMGVASLMFLEAKRPKWWRWILALAMLVVEFFIMSKSSLLATGIVFVGCFFWNSFRSIKAHPFRSLAFFLLGLGIIGFVIASPFLDGYGIEALDRYSTLILERFTQLFSSTEGSTSSRLNCFKIAWEAISSTKLSMLLGFGFANWKNAIYAYHGGFLPLDNAFVEDLARGGILSLALSLFIWIFFFALICRALKRRSPYGIPLLFAYFGYLTRAFFEASSFLNPNITSIIMDLMIALPLLTLEAEEKPLYDTQKNVMEYQTISPKREVSRVFLGSYAVLYPLLSILYIIFYRSIDIVSLTSTDPWFITTIMTGTILVPFTLALSLHLWRELRVWRGLLGILLFAVQALITFLMPFYIGGAGAFILSFVPLILILLVAGPYFVDPKDILRAIFCYVLPYIVLLFVPPLYEYLGNNITDYPLTMMVIFAISLYFMVDCFSSSYSPFTAISLPLERRISSISTRREAKTERKYLIYRYGKRHKRC